jgi:hypothetical protein
LEDALRELAFENDSSAAGIDEAVETSDSFAADVAGRCSDCRISMDPDGFSEPRGQKNFS